ncbi:thiamine pyrophosphate-requiring protein [Maritimibacter sp. UBA3975]|uniref:thiamine pyrophosphate-requiring protein n=1 Tax=Maritimibacter sp. UBA3975 TaxID=1946833 RepID=UPI000C09FF07|nr:thiamine pyrophosphate-requiring protein [Maritimibacter sp. UBA3975]MAM59886.1 acetolactate synthase [Maritimibacter sp.]|tara:strand:+ start:21914 stop:23629 length:1716 start_codon:yes stop_codon:yes gene_type:complete
MDDSAPDRSTITAGGAIFGKLKALGVDHVFANSGTDFPPIIEGLVQAQRSGIDLPEPITCPHESVAVGMAHGYYQMTGRPQAVMLHTNVGLGNAVTGAINAWCDQVPMILMSGRTPVVESGRFGARSTPINWGQEMFDQSSLIRECTKWDYELRFPEQVSDLFDRCWAIANSTPKGPVYLSLPREVLCEPTPATGLDQPSALSPTVAAPDPAALDRAARLLAEADKPLIIAQRGVGTQEAFDAFAGFVTDRALPVSQYWPNQIALATGHPMHIGWSPNAFLEEADVVLVLDSLAPWWPDTVTLRPDVKVIQLGPDPLFSRTPVRNFASHVSLAGETGPTLLALIEAVAALPRDETRLATRRDRITTAARATRAENTKVAQQGDGCPMTKAWVSHCLSAAIRGRTATVYHELGCPLTHLDLDAHKSYFQEPHSGGLGWGFAAALGAQLADRDRLIFATMGDGSYMFANPTVCHQVAEAYDLPVIVLVLNNGEWGAVRHGTQSLYADGDVSRANEVPMTALTPSPDFTRTAEASRAFAVTITDGKDLPAALERAIEVATGERRQVLLNIAIAR